MDVPPESVRRVAAMGGHLNVGDTADSSKSRLLTHFSESAQSISGPFRYIHLPSPDAGHKKNAALGAAVGMTKQPANYFALINATVVSSMRLLKPHSLSYHDETFTSRPETLVSVASKVDEAGLWLKSTDTSGAVL